MSRFLLFLLPAAIASAQELTLAEALRRADEAHPALRAQGHSARAVSALIDQASARPNPTLDVGLENFAGTGALRGLDGSETTVQFTQAFERGGKREKRVALARGEHASAEAELAVRRAEIRAATVSAYVEVVAAQRRVALAGDALGLAAETAADVEARVKAAAASPAEIARARAALALARSESTRADAALVAARAALASHWSGRPEDVPALADALPVPAELPAPETLAAKLAGHPRLALQRSLIAGRRAALQLEQARVRQDVTVSGGVRFLRDGSDAGLVAGVSVPLPFRGQNQGSIRAAREILAGAELAVAVVENELRAAFSSAWSELTAAHAVARDLRRDALPAAEEALAIVRHAWTQGELPFHEVLEAQRALSALRRDLLAAETESASAFVRLEALADSTFPLTTALFSAK